MLFNLQANTSGCGEWSDDYMSWTDDLEAIINRKREIEVAPWYDGFPLRVLWKSGNGDIVVELSDGDLDRDREKMIATIRSLVIDTGKKFGLNFTH